MYFGLIYRNPDGTCHATPAVPGVFTIVSASTIESAIKEVPEGATIAASYHTHVNTSAASVEGREEFSGRDPAGFREAADFDLNASPRKVVSG